MPVSEEEIKEIFSFSSKEEIFPFIFTSETVKKKKKFTFEKKKKKKS